MRHAFSRVSAQIRQGVRVRTLLLLVLVLPIFTYFPGENGPRILSSFLPLRGFSVPRFTWIFGSLLVPNASVARTYVPNQVPLVQETEDSTTLLTGSTRTEILLSPNAHIQIWVHLLWCVLPSLANGDVKLESASLDEGLSEAMVLVTGLEREERERVAFSILTQRRSTQVLLSVSTFRRTHTLSHLNTQGVLWFVSVSGAQTRCPTSWGVQALRERMTQTMFMTSSGVPNLDVE